MQETARQCWGSARPTDWMWNSAASADGRSCCRIGLPLVQFGKWSALKMPGPGKRQTKIAGTDKKVNYRKPIARRRSRQKKILVRAGGAVETQ